MRSRSTQLARVRPFLPGISFFVGKEGKIERERERERERELFSDRENVVKYSLRTPEDSPNRQKIA
jgi:hypothetical protein